jgi:hypothetical protein
LIAGALVYNVATSVLLAFAGLTLVTPVAALWPVVALHATMAIWCGATLRA